MHRLTRAVLLASLAISSATFAAERALCPVCATVEGKREAETVEVRRTHAGVSYGLCSEKCAKAFDAEPAAYVPPTFPRAAPELYALDFDDKPITWTSFEGDLVLLDFWATWCAPCRKSMPDLQRLHEKYGARGLTVLGISIDEAKAARKARVAAKKYGYRFAFDSGASPTWQRFGVKAIPAAFLVDAQGNIVAQWTGMPADVRELEEKILAHLPARP